MAGLLKKISEFPDGGSSLALADIIPLVQSGTTKRATVGEVGFYSIEYVTSWVNAKDPKYATLQDVLDTGHDVFMPAGTYTPSAALTGATNNQILQGSGAGTRIVSSHLTNDILQFGNGTDGLRNVQLRDFVIWASVTKTGGKSLFMRKAYNCHVERVFVGTPEDYAADGHMLYDGIVFAEFDNSTVDNCRMQVGNDGLTIYGNSSGTCAAGLWVGGGSRSVGCGRDAVHISGGAGGLYFDNMDISVPVRHGILVDPDTVGLKNRELFLGPTLTIDGCGNRGLQFNAGSIGPVSINGTWICSNGVGVDVKANQDGQFFLSMNGPKIWNNQSDGFIISSGAFALGGAFRVSNNGTGAGGGHGIWVAIDTGCPFDILGGIIANNGNVTKGIGLVIEDGNDYYSAQGIVFKENGQGTISNVPGTAATRLVQNNVLG